MNEEEFAKYLHGLIEQYIEDLCLLDGETVVLCVRGEETMLDGLDAGWYSAPK